MSPRTACVALALIFGLGGCGGGGYDKKTTAGEPTTAKEKQLLEAKAAGDPDATGQTSWGKWRYTGDRGNCFFVAGKKCFKTEVTACQAMRCKAGVKCKSSGAGPATVACAK